MYKKLFLAVFATCALHSVTWAGDVSCDELTMRRIFTFFVCAPNPVGVTAVVEEPGSPLSPYAEAKQAVEQAGEAFMVIYNMRAEADVVAAWNSLSFLSAKYVAYRDEYHRHPQVAKQGMRLNVATKSCVRRLFSDASPAVADSVEIPLSFAESRRRIIFALMRLFYDACISVLGANALSMIDAKYASDLIVSGRVKRYREVFGC
ncbi:MAG: hypothetical protein QG604_756 [Candidatus Dependentiae bacterium]|nr:hypothetical protein [Candidatus Dependentiae bacterium]